MFSAHLTKFKFTILAAVALLACQWRIKLKDKNDNWGPPRNVNVSWGLKKKYQYHYVIKREWFPCC